MLFISIVNWIYSIICLEVNPVNDFFLTSAKDQKFKLWDLSKDDEAPLAVVDLSTKNSLVVGNFDPAGVLFALAYMDNHGNENPTNKIRLYDIERYVEVLIYFNTFSEENIFSHFLILIHNLVGKL